MLFHTLEPHRLGRRIRPEILLQHSASSVSGNLHLCFALCVIPAMQMTNRGRCERDLGDPQNADCSRQRVVSYIVCENTTPPLPFAPV